jgi:hypothetical protein
MSWKIETESDQCPFWCKNKLCGFIERYEARQEICSESTCPLKPKPMSEEEAKKLINALTTPLRETLRGKMEVTDGILAVGEAHETLLAALTGKESK